MAPFQGASILFAFRGRAHALAHGYLNVAAFAAIARLRRLQTLSRTNGTNGTDETNGTRMNGILILEFAKVP